MSTARHLSSGSFEFNEEISAIFPDMAARSIPGYHDAWRMIAEIGAGVLNPGSTMVDLGCSHGQGLSAVRARLGDRRRDVDFIGVDASGHMIGHAMDACPWAHLMIRNLNRWEPTALNGPGGGRNIKLITFAWVLQFITDLERRVDLLMDAYNALERGGCVVVLEKWHTDDPVAERQLQAAYEAFRRANGYTQEEIDAKTKALEGVMVTTTPQWTASMMRLAGFYRVTPLYTLYNFGGFVAFKD